MAQIGFRHSEAFRRKVKEQKLLASSSFDLQLSIDTKNTTLWTIVLALLAAERLRQKVKIFNQKRSKFEIFRYLRVIYLKRKLRTCTLLIQKEKVWFFAKEQLFLKFLIFFFKGRTLWCQNCFFFKFFKNLKKRIPQMTLIGPLKHEKEESQEFWVA